MKNSVTPRCQELRHRPSQDSRKPGENHAICVCRATLFSVKLEGPSLQGYTSGFHSSRAVTNATAEDDKHRESCRTTAEPHHTDPVILLCGNLFCSCCLPVLRHCCTRVPQITALVPAGVASGSTGTLCNPPPSITPPAHHITLSLSL